MIEHYPISFSIHLACFAAFMVIPVVLASLHKDSIDHDMKSAVTIVSTIGALMTSFHFFLDP